MQMFASLPKMLLDYMKASEKINNELGLNEFTITIHETTPLHPPLLVRFLRCPSLLYSASFELMTFQSVSLLPCLSLQPQRRRFLITPPPRL